MENKNRFLVIILLVIVVAAVVVGTLVLRKRSQNGALQAGEGGSTMMGKPSPSKREPVRKKEVLEQAKPYVGNERPPVYPDPIMTPPEETK